MIISSNTPLIILILATVYVLAIYLLLNLAQGRLKLPKLRLGRVNPSHSRSGFR